MFFVCNFTLSYAAAQLALVKQHCALMRARMEPSWTPQVTHVIIRCESGRKCKRTLKYVQGLLSGSHIVCSDWIDECIRQRKWVPEAGYLVQEDSGGGEQAVDRMQARLSNGLPKLFSELKVFFWGSFPDAACSREDLVLTALAGGATILDTAPLPFEIDASVVVICNNHLEMEEGQRLWDECGHDGIFYQWLFDCASQVRIIPVANNDKYKCTFFEDIEFPMMTQDSPAL